MFPALKITDLRKTYGGIPVVDGLSLEIQPGEIFGLLGPNGAGKSTTINIVSGVARLETGKVEVFGNDNQKEFRQTRRDVGVMHQEIIIDPFFEIGRALKIHSGFYGAPDDPTWRELLIERLALGPHLHKRMNKLSGGTKRRFMVAKAMIHRPRLLILDEPTAGVDVQLRRDLWDFVLEINRAGTTVLLTTHYLEEAEAMCGRIAIMDAGRLVVMDTAVNLLSRLDKKKLQVRIKHMPEDILHTLKAFNPRRLEPALLEFRLASDEESDSILRAIFGAGLKVEEVQTVTSSLEDVFLKLTGRGAEGRIS